MSQLPQTDARAEQRQRLLEGLAQSIRDNGLAATQISDIVRNARASRRTFYRSFSDKEACFVALAELLRDRMLSEVEAAIDRKAPLPAQIDQAIDRYIALLAAEPATVTFWRELPVLGARGAQIERQGIERYAELLVRVAGDDAGARDAAVRPVSTEKAIMLVGGMREMIVHAVDHGRPLTDVAELAKEVFRAVLASNGG